MSCLLFNTSIKSKLLLYLVELHEFNSKVYREIVRCSNMEYKRCPYCNRELSHFDDTGAEKHVARCSKVLSQYVCTGRPKGRPKA
nr:MAG TPA: envelope glycoprotein [Bacteriophage sp.]